MFRRGLDGEGPFSVYRHFCCAMSPMIQCSVLPLLDNPNVVFINDQALQLIFRSAWILACESHLFSCVLLEDVKATLFITIMDAVDRKSVV